MLSQSQFGSIPVQLSQLDQVNYHELSPHSYLNSGNTVNLQNLRLEDALADEDGDIFYDAQETLEDEVEEANKQQFTHMFGNVKVQPAQN